MMASRRRAFGPRPPDLDRVFRFVSELQVGHSLRRRRVAASCQLRGRCMSIGKPITSFGSSRRTPTALGPGLRLTSGQNSVTKPARETSSLARYRKVLSTPLLLERTSSPLSPWKAVFVTPPMSSSFFSLAASCRACFFCSRKIALEPRRAGSKESEEVASGTLTGRGRPGQVRSDREKQTVEK